MNASGPLPLRLAAPAWRRIRELAAAAWPHEACGLLVGSSLTATRPVQAIACRNLATDPEQGYCIDPETFLHIEHAARARGGAVIGVWHSHPHGDPTPSERDRREAWPNWSYLIVGTDGARVTPPRAWRLDGRQCREQQVAILGPHAGARAAGLERRHRECYKRSLTTA